MFLWNFFEFVHQDHKRLQKEVQNSNAEFCLHLQILSEKVISDQEEEPRLWNSLQ